jgi:hypothetical protein
MLCGGEHEVRLDTRAPTATFTLLGMSFLEGISPWCLSPAAPAVLMSFEGRGAYAWVGSTPTVSNVPYTCQPRRASWWSLWNQPDPRPSYVSAVSCLVHLSPPPLWEIPALGAGIRTGSPRANSWAQEF